MKTNIAIVIASTLLISSTAQAAGWNADIFSGESNGSGATDFDESYGIGLSKQRTNRVGTGFELGRNKSNNGTTARHLMVTGEYDFMQRGRFSAYGGAGLGAIRAKGAQSDTVAGGRLSLGTRMAITPRTKLFLEARHLEAFKDPRTAAGGGRDEFKGNSVHLGIRFRF